MEQKLLSTAADVLGVSSDDLKSQLASGKTIADIASAQGISADDFRAAMKKAMEQQGPPPPPPPPGGRGGLDPETQDRVTSAIANVLGASTDDLKAQISSGKSLQDLLKEKGVSDDDLRNAIEDALSTRRAYDQTGAQHAGARIQSGWQVNTSG